MPVRHAGRRSARRQFMHLVKAPGDGSSSSLRGRGRVLGKSGCENYEQSRQYDSSTPCTMAQPSLHSSHFQFLLFFRLADKCLHNASGGAHRCSSSKFHKRNLDNRAKMPTACFGIRCPPSFRSEVSSGVIWVAKRAQAQAALCQCSTNCPVTRNAQSGEREQRFLLMK